MSRRDRLEAMLAEQPSDQFLRYSLAMELVKEGDYERGLEYFDALTRDAEPYVAAYFMAAQNLVRWSSAPSAPADCLDRARGYLRDGIERARQVGDHHAAAEMSEYLASLGTDSR